MKAIVSILTLIFCALVFVALNPKLRAKIREQNPFKDQSRDVVAVVEGTFNKENLSFYKLRTNQGVVIEVYTRPKSGDPTLLQKLEIPQTKDGILEVQKNPTRMVLTDFDGDGDNELVVPVFDTQMRPLLYIYKYNISSKQFDQVSP